MRLIHCTNKLISEINTALLPKYENHINEGLGDWYSNVFIVKLRYCLIFTNIKTLFTFVVPDLSKKELVDFHHLFLKGLENALQLNGIKRETINRIIEEYTRVQIVKTESKSVIGSMNDFVQHYISFEKYMDENNQTINDFNLNVNGIPMGALKFEFPIERLNKLIETEYK